MFILFIAICLNSKEGEYYDDCILLKKNIFHCVVAQAAK